MTGRLLPEVRLVENALGFVGYDGLPKLLVSTAGTVSLDRRAAVNGVGVLLLVAAPGHGSVSTSRRLHVGADAVPSSTSLL